MISILHLLNIYLKNFLFPYENLGGPPIDKPIKSLMCKSLPIIKISVFQIRLQLKGTNNL